MPLPEKVIDQLGRNPQEGQQGWAFGLIFFSGGILVLMILLYAGISFAYMPYLNTQLSSAQDQVSTVGRSISPTDQTSVIDFYSQVSNLKTLLANHQATDQVFAWLEKNTEANVYFSDFNLSAGNHITLKGQGKLESDVNQQLAIFENSPEVSSVTISSVTNAQAGSGYQFNVTLVMNPSVFSTSSQ